MFGHNKHFSCLSFIYANCNVTSHNTSFYMDVELLSAQNMWYLFQELVIFALQTCDLCFQELVSWFIHIWHSIVHSHKFFIYDSFTFDIPLFIHDETKAHSPIVPTQRTTQCHFLAQYINTTHPNTIQTTHTIIILILQSTFSTFSSSFLCFSFLVHIWVFFESTSSLTGNASPPVNPPTAQFDGRTTTMSVL
jgi:hypothetical protein